MQHSRGRGVGAAAHCSQQLAAPLRRRSMAAPVGEGRPALRLLVCLACQLRSGQGAERLQRIRRGDGELTGGPSGTLPIARLGRANTPRGQVERKSRGWRSTSCVPGSSPIRGVWGVCDRNVWCVVRLHTLSCMEDAGHHQIASICNGLIAVKVSRTVADQVCVCPKRLNSDHTPKSETGLFGGFWPPSDRFPALFRATPHDLGTALDSASSPQVAWAAVQGPTGLTRRETAAAE